MKGVLHLVGNSRLVKFFTYGYSISTSIEPSIRPVQKVAKLVFRASPVSSCVSMKGAKDDNYFFQHQRDTKQRQSTTLLNILLYFRSQFSLSNNRLLNKPGISWRVTCLRVRSSGEINIRREPHRFRVSAPPPPPYSLARGLGARGGGSGRRWVIKQFHYVGIIILEENAKNTGKYRALYCQSVS